MSVGGVVHLLADDVAPNTLRAGVAVVIDVLRASTSIVTALANGARAVIACEEVEQAWAVTAREGRHGVLLGGERKGIRVPGFDLGNSPAEYTREVCRGRKIVFTTTNGTRALMRCAEAEQVYVGCFVNRAALCRRLAETHRAIHLVCAGTDGEVSAEDVLAAGAMVAALQVMGLARWGNEEAMLAWQAFEGCKDHLRSVVDEGRGAANLKQLGMDRDIDDALRLDAIDLVPVFDATTHEIVA